MNHLPVNDRIAFSPSQKDNIHTFLCITDIRKAEIERHVLNILHAQKELSMPDALLEIRDTIGLSIQEWMWVFHFLTQLNNEHEVRQSLAKKPIFVHRH